MGKVLRGGKTSAMPRSTQRDHPISYSIYEAEERRGADVLLLHGLGSCAEDWGLQIPALTHRHRALAADLPGHGKSPMLHGRPSIAQIAACLMEAVQPELDGSVHLVGLSLGGLVALQCALDAPRWVRSLTVVNAFARMQAPSGSHGRLLMRLLLLSFAPMSWLGRWVAAGLFPEPGQGALREMAAARLASNPRRAYFELALAVARFDARAGLDRICCPVLIVAGEQDRTVALEAKLELMRGIPGARLVRLPGSGHASPVDNHAAFNAALLDFLDEADKRYVRQPDYFASS